MDRLASASTAVDERPSKEAQETAQQTETDVKNGATHETKDVAHDHESLEDFFIEPSVEKRILRKQDMALGPMIGILYFLSYLDRSNIGNAGTSGLIKDLGLHGRQFNDAASLFYVTYVVLETPAALSMRYFGANVIIPAVALAWGLVTLFSGFVQNFGGLVATRLILGCCEAALFPCLNLLLPAFYLREELAKRTAMIFGASAISSAFGGLFAYGILQMDGVGGYAGWRWLYILEGILSVLIATLMFFILPDNPSQAWFLTPEERELATKRIAKVKLYHGAGPLDWSEVRRAFKDWKLYVSALSQFGADVALYGFSTFLPTILSGLGYDTLKRQYMTIPVYAVGAISYFIVAYFSDRTQLRGLPLMVMALFPIAGYGILIGVKSSYGVLYFACFLISIGLYVGPGLNVTWLNVNSAGQWKRSTAIGFQQSMANTSGILSGQLYTSNNAPRYLTGNLVTIIFVCVSEVAYVVQWLALRHANQTRDRIADGTKERPPDADERKGDANLSFRYAL